MTTIARPRPVFIAALQREIAGLVHGWRADETLPARKIHLYWNDDAIVACAGMGAHRVRFAVEAALTLGPAAEPGARKAEGVVVTVAAPAGVAEKQRLYQSYAAAAVDMEAAAVARIALTQDLPFSAIKAISDEAGFELPAMQRFATPDGQFREAAFGLHVAGHPALWRPVLAMARGSKLAADRLQAEIKAHIQHHRNRNA